jgi:hypothetical protein
MAPLRQVGAVKHAKPGDFEANLGACEITSRVRFAEEIARRMAIIATGNARQILATLDLRVVGAERRHCQ